MEKQKEDSLLVLFTDAHVFLSSLIKQLTTSGCNWIKMLGSLKQRQPSGLLSANQSQVGTSISGSAFHFAVLN